LLAVIATPFRSYRRDDRGRLAGGAAASLAVSLSTNSVTVLDNSDTALSLSTFPALAISATRRTVLNSFQIVVIVMQDAQSKMRFQTPYDTVKQSFCSSRSLINWLLT
jgi:hypothetical protein